MPRSKWTQTLMPRHGGTPLALLVVLMVGCSTGSSFGGGGKKKEKKAAKAPQSEPVTKSDTMTTREEQSASGPISIEDAIAQKPDEATFVQFSSIPTIEFFAGLETKANNEPVTIRGYTLHNLADHLSLLQISDLTDQFQTMGEIAEAAGVHGPGDILDEQLDSGLAVLEEATSGNILDWLAAREAAFDQQGDDSGGADNMNANTRKLALADAGSCALSVLGAVGATVGAGAACVGTGGVACGGAGIGAAASYGWVAKNCPPPPKGVVCLTTCTQDQADQVGDAMQYAIK